MYGVAEKMKAATHKAIKPCELRKNVRTFVSLFMEYVDLKVFLLQFQQLLLRQDLKET